MAETNLRQATAKAHVIGTVSDMDLKLETDKDTGAKSIRGSLTVKTDETNFVRYNVNVAEMTKAGKENQAWAGIMTVMNEYKSIVAVGAEEADKVRVNGDINLYRNQNGNDVVSYKSNFFTRISEFDDDKNAPKAEFEVEMFISSILPEMDKEGEETGRVIVSGWVPTYNGIEPIKLIANEEIADAVDSTLEPGQTTTFYGNIVNSKVEIIKEIPVAIGKPRREVKTSYKNELVITGIAPVYEEGVTAVKPYEADTIKAAIQERENRIAEQNNKAQSAPTTAKPSGKAHGRTLGF